MREGGDTGAGFGPLVFAPEATGALGRRVASHLGVPLAPLEERDFSDGEHKIRPMVEVRNRDVFVVQSLHGDRHGSPNDKWVRLLFLLGALRDAGAERVTAVVPYLCYARKERKTKDRDPVATRYVAGCFEAVGVDAVVTLDVHDLASFQNAYRCATEHVEARQLLVAHMADSLAGESEVVVVSPDAGGFKRAQAFRESLERRLGRGVGITFLEKRRSAGEVSGGSRVGGVEGAAAVIVDDLIAGGTTLVRAAEACRKGDARRVLAAATHGLFNDDADEKLAASPIERLWVTDSVLAGRSDAPAERPGLAVVGCGGLLAEAIRRIHGGPPAEAGASDPG
jgi:ribose-phosphate pyrophosphokinase